MAQQQQGITDTSIATTDMKGLTKAAILMVSMEAESSATVLQQLTQSQVEEVTREIAHLDIVGPELRGKVVEEFYNLPLPANISNRAVSPMLAYFSNGRYPRTRQAVSSNPSSTKCI